MSIFSEIRIGFLYITSLKKREWIFYFFVYSNVSEAGFFELQGLIVSPTILVARQRSMHEVIKIFIKYSNSGRIRLLILFCIGFNWLLLRKVFTTPLFYQKIVDFLTILLDQVLIVGIL